MDSFASIGFLSTLQDTLKEMKLFKPTPIQVKALPALMAGRSVVGISQTGSGKTLAYALPILHKSKVFETEQSMITQSSQPRALVMVPTRDLGEQVSKVLKPFTHTTRLRVRTLLGGTTLEVAKKNISGAFEILVATPGRLVQMLDRNLIHLNDVQMLVFDEADQMLDPSFLADAKSIVEACAPGRQMSLFSATVPANLQGLIQELFSEAEMIRIEGSHRVVPTLTTINKLIPNGYRLPVLEEFLSKKVEGGTLIFVNTREQCDELAQLMHTKGYKGLVYRGEMDKVERRNNLKAFREQKAAFLISTDLGSRGLDVDHVGRVINYHLPQEMENYLHRAGRTARAGRKGTVINLVTRRDEALMRRLEAKK